MPSGVTPTLSKASLMDIVVMDLVSANSQGSFSSVATKNYEMHFRCNPTCRTGTTKAHSFLRSNDSNVK